MICVPCFFSNILKKNVGHIHIWSISDCLALDVTISVFVSSKDKGVKS